MALTHAEFESWATRMLRIWHQNETLLDSAGIHADVVRALEEAYEDGLEEGQKSHANS